MHLRALKNYAFPFCRAHTVTADEISQLLFDYLLLSHGGEQTEVLHSNVRPRLVAHTVAATPCDGGRGCSLA